VLTKGASESLDVGRKTRVVPAGMRRALVVRDGGCLLPGCGRPQAWCDAHHIEHWADGGARALENLVLLCRPHHRAVHEDFRAEMTDGRPAFWRSDGSRLGEDRAPPWGPNGRPQPARKPATSESVSLRNFRRLVWLRSSTPASM
jgi:hypothetical protein